MTYPTCPGSVTFHGTSPGQRYGVSQTGKSTHARGVHCSHCGRTFDACKVIETSQGIALGSPTAVIPRHKEAV